MVIDALESAVQKKPAEQKRRTYAFTLDPQTAVILQGLSDSWGISMSKLVERAVRLLAVEVEKDPSKLKEPPSE